jgi:hypothetical protein
MNMILLRAIESYRVITTLEPKMSNPLKF